MDTNILNKILHFHNKFVDSSIINSQQIKTLVTGLLHVIDNSVEGDVVELGCYVGESSKYLQKTLSETESFKRLYVYDSFEGLPPLSEHEKNTGWKPNTLKTTQNVLIQNFKDNNLVPPIITKSWFKDIPIERIPQQICFAFLDGDFYDSIYDSLGKIYERVSDGGLICIHDYKRPDLPGVEIAINDFFKEKGLTVNVYAPCDQIGVICKNKNLDKSVFETVTNTILQVLESTSVKKGGTTIVTGLWDIGRQKLKDNWSRSFEHYLTKFEELLKFENNMIIFGDSELKEFVMNRRQNHNTQFIERSLEWFKNNEFFEPIQKIRNNPLWYNQAGWLTDSTQAKLELYNPLVMSKMFLLHDAKILDSFDSSHLFWIDAGITNTIHPGYFTHDKVIEKLSSLYTHFSFVCFPYEANTEVHGFDYEELCKLARTKTNKVARGGFFGGPKETLSQANSIYYDLLKTTLNKGFMGTEESLFTLMVYKHPELFQYAEIEFNGLMGKFFEDLKNDTVQLKHETIIHPSNSLKTSSKPFTDQSALYVLTFNSPKQFETLIESMNVYDSHFLNKTTKYLLDNSTDLSTTPRYQELCSQHGFEHIKKDNLGICGGRQFIAEHFASTDLEYMMFFEDDMFFYPHKGEVCKNGFNRYVDNLYLKIMKIISQEGFDFLKFSFTEFFGSNSKQWSWYNVPQAKREEYWPHYCKLPEHGIDPYSPSTEFKNIQSLDGLAYATGEIYYSNWPQIVSKAGNQKMFLDTKWGHPYEQTWMSHIYQLTKDEKIHPGILLLSPTEHNRFEHYSGSLRKES